MMRTALNSLFALLLVAHAVGVVDPVSAAIIVTGNEVWDGVSNPRAVDGVMLVGGVYTIPTELVIGSGAKLSLNSSRYELGATPSGSITFDFTPGAGGLTFVDNTSVLDVHSGDRFGSTTTFTLNMQDNPIQGPGRLVNGPVLLAETGKGMFVTINSLSNVSLGEINVSKKDASLAQIDITAHGAVDIDSLSTADVVDGGASGGAIFIKGQSLNLGSLDTRAQRMDGNADNGNISLTALDPPSFDANNAVGNQAAENIITLSGLINTNGAATGGPNVGGNVNVTAVKLVLGSGFALDIGENGSTSFKAGVLGGGYSAGDLFMNMSSVSNVAPQFTVLHGVPEPTSLVLLLLCAGPALVTRRIRR